MAVGGGGRPCYGMNAGDTICSAPLVGIDTGAPPLAPIGWMYTRNTFFCTAPTRPSRSPAPATAKSVAISSPPRDGEGRGHQIRARERRDLAGRQVRPDHLGRRASPLLLLHQIGERAV